MPRLSTGLIALRPQLGHRQNLGSHSLMRNSAPKVFNIRYDQTLGHTILAQAFFPSQSRKDWQLCIGPDLVDKRSYDYLRYIPNVTAHEFAHILGLGHWDAGFNDLNVPSMLWSGTIERSRESVMNTGVHPRQVRFSDEDLQVIRETAHGDLRAGRMIIDINPFEFC